MQQVPFHVQQAIDGYTSSDDLTVISPTGAETSVIFKYGVRVQVVVNDVLVLGWICLATESCRTSSKPAFFPLYNGKTSAATKHLKSKHNIESSKTQSAEKNKRSRDEAISALRNSRLYEEDPRRLRLLLETLRIINNNLPFRSVEYRDSALLNGLVVKSEMQMPINAKMIVHSVVELYDSTKSEIANILRVNRLRPASSFTVVADFWSCKVTKDKFLGLRLYLVDEAFTFRSFLLGTRHFKPGYEEREGGIPAPFRSWIKAILADFEVDESDLFGSTTDGGPDVKHMMQETLGLQWECCIPHLTNAATKMACGESSGLDNPDMQELVTKLKRTVFSTKAVEVVGSLFTDLCSVLNPDSK